MWETATWERTCNFGCGTVTVNYDRAKKYRTVIEDSAFIGCNTNLIAPVRVGEGAYIAAGSTITDDIPAMALSIARARQQNKQGLGQQAQGQGKVNPVFLRRKPAE